MRILLCHTYYQLRGGEDAVFEQEYSLLKKDHIVENLSFSNKGGWRGALQFFMSLWNFKAISKLKLHIEEFKPDVIHIHNWHFASGPSIIYAANKMGIPIVLTLHNFRLLCPSATLLHDGKIFEASLNSSFPWLAIQNKVYRNSTILTFWLAFVVYFHKKIGTWTKVDRFITLTSFAKDLYHKSSLRIPKEKLVVKPNFVHDNNGISDRADHFLFVGRLSKEKGIDLLLNAFRSTEGRLVVAGKGFLSVEVEKAQRENLNISYVGDLTPSEVQSQMLKCTALLFPSIWYEGMPMTIIEAFSTSTPVIASNLGSMAAMIKHGYNGLLFEPGDAEDLKRTITHWQNLSDEAKIQYQKNARDTYEHLYKPEENLEHLLAIYKDLF